MKAALLLAAGVYAVSFPNQIRSLFARRTNSHESTAIIQGLETLRRTETGRKLFKELGLDPDQPSSLEAFEKRGITFHTAKLSNHATTQVAWSDVLRRRAGRFRITLKKALLKAPDNVLAPLLAHELAHASDRKQAPNQLEIDAPSERRGYLLQVHTLIELEDQGRLPEPNMTDTTALALVRDHRGLLRAYRGLRMDPYRYGKQNADITRMIDRERADKVGLGALRLHITFKKSLGQNVGDWDTSRPEEQTEYIRHYYDKVAEEDYMFRISRPGPRAELGPDPGPVGGGQAEIDPNSGKPVGWGKAQIGESSLSRDAVTLAQDICRAGASPVLAMEVAKKWPNAGSEVRSRVRRLKESTTDPCVTRVLTGLLERRSFTEADLLSLAQEPAPPPSGNDDGKPDKPKRCFKFGIWTKEEYCF